MSNLINRSRRRLKNLIGGIYTDWPKPRIQSVLWDSSPIYGSQFNVTWIDEVVDTGMYLDMTGAFFTNESPTNP